MRGITLTEDVAEGVRGADFVVTDVWVSMGEPKEVWDERIAALAPYAVTMDVLRATGNADVKFLHCLPAFHDLGTKVAREIHERHGLADAGGHRRGLRVRALGRLRRGREPDAHDQGGPGRDAGGRSSSPPPPLPVPSPSLGPAPPAPHTALKGLVLKRRTGWMVPTGVGGVRVKPRRPMPLGRHHRHREPHRLAESVVR